jgi:hypothetical protein
MTPTPEFTAILMAADKLTGVLSGIPGPQGPAGPQGPPGPMTSVLLYRADATSQGRNDPGAGKIRWNSETQRLSTALYVDVLTADGFDALSLFRLTPALAQFVIQDKDLSQNSQTWSVTAPVIEYPDWFEVPVSLLFTTGAGEFSNNTQLAVLTIAPSVDGIKDLREEIVAIWKAIKDLQGKLP